MLSTEGFIQQSLELHLFFIRIMKEHSFFLEAGFTTRDSTYIQRADEFRKAFDKLLGEVVAISNGVISQGVLQSGEVVTPHTLNAERVSAFFTGVTIPTELTESELKIMPAHSMSINPALEQRVAEINRRSIELTTALIQFKQNVLSNVLSCKLFTVNYPLLIEHILREANLYARTVQRLQNREEILLGKDIIEQELFWNQIMGEHALFIRGLLDPTEHELIVAAQNFGNEFSKLTAEAKAAVDSTLSVAKVTADSRVATQKIKGFKEAGTKGLLECKIKSIIIPLLGDHVLREANRYLRLLSIFQSR